MKILLLSLLFLSSILISTYAIKIPKCQVEVEIESAGN